MDAEQLRKYGHKMVNFIVDYYKNNENNQVQVFTISINYFLVKGLAVA